MRSLESRIRKLEADLPKRDRPAFLIFGRSLEEVAASRSAAKSAGRVPVGSCCCDVIWRGADPVPAPRLTPIDGMTEEEIEDFVATACEYIGCPPTPRGDPSYALDLAQIIEALKAHLRSGVH